MDMKYLLTQSADYDIITKFLILHIWKTYLNGDDIGNALENQQETEFNDTTKQDPIELLLAIKEIS